MGAKAVCVTWYYWSHHVGGYFTVSKRRLSAQHNMVVTSAMLTRCVIYKANFSTLPFGLRLSPFHFRIHSFVNLNLWLLT